MKTSSRAILFAVVLMTLPARAYSVPIIPEAINDEDPPAAFAAEPVTITILGIVVGLGGIAIDLIAMLGLDKDDVPVGLNLTVDGDRKEISFLLQGGELLDDVALNLGGTLRGPTEETTGADLWAWALTLTVD